MDEAFFKARYEADASNRAKQSWKEYQDWVRTFYEGKRFPPVPGWESRQKEILARMPAAHHPQVQDALRRMGLTLAAEWAKDNAVRKVSTSDLQSWGKRFSDAARQPESLLDALREVEEEMRKRGAAP